MKDNVLNIVVDVLLFLLLALSFLERGHGEMFYRVVVACC